MAGPIHVAECGYLDPVAAFTRFAAEPFALLFDSALKDPDHGRYAFIAADPFAIDGVTFGYNGDLCSFDTFLDHFGVEDESLRLIARIVRGADTAEFDLEPQCAGLSALALGISALHDDDLSALNRGIALYDGLYAWARRETDDRSSTRSAA